MIKYDESYKLKQGSLFAVADENLSGAKLKQHTFLHYHRDMELLFIDRGETLLHISGREIYAKEGNLIIVNPYEVHSGIVMSENYKHRCICFDMEQLALPESDKIFSGAKGYANLIEDTAALKGYFNSCFNAIKNRGESFELCAKGNLLLMFSMLCGKIVGVKEDKDRIFLQDLVKYIERHYCEPITSQTTAKVFSYNHSYFCRKFKMIFSQNFSDYLNAYRILMARSMLKTKSISRTAYDCGYKSSGYFCCMFKKLCGVTPLQYKKNAD